MKRLALLLPLIYLFNCQLSSSKFELMFYQLQQLVSEQQYAEVLEHLDANSHHYLDMLIKALESQDAAAAKETGSIYGCPLSTLKTYYLLERSVEGDSISMDKEGLLFALGLAGQSFLDVRQIGRYKFDGVNFVSDGDASINILTKVNNTETYILSSFYFVLEEDDWKFNLPATFSLDEKLLKQLLQKSGQTPEAFLQEFVANSPDYYEFQYRSRK